MKYTEAREVIESALVQLDEIGEPPDRRLRAAIDHHANQVGIHTALHHQTLGDPHHKAQAAAHQRAHDAAVAAHKKLTGSDYTAKPLRNKTPWNLTLKEGKVKQINKQKKAKWLEGRGHAMSPRAFQTSEDHRAALRGNARDAMRRNAGESLGEAILKGKSARRSILLKRKKAGEEMARKRKEMSNQPPATAYLATGMISPEVDPTKKVAKRKSDARGIVARGSGDFSGVAKAVDANKKNAQSIIDVFHRKPHGTKVTVYGKKHGKDAEHTMKISKTRKMGTDVHVVHGTDRVVHLNPSGAGLQVIDAKSKRILLDKGHDAEW